MRCAPDYPSECPTLRPASGDARYVFLRGVSLRDGSALEIMRKLVALRRMDQSDRQEEEELLDLYRRAIGV